MKKNLKFLILSAMVALSCSMPQAVRGMENLPMLEKHKKPSVMQLAKGADDTLEAPLGTGSNALLKISMDLKDLRKPTDQEHLEVPVRLFLTDFTSSPTNHPAVHLQVKVDCESTPLRCVLPDKPASFGSYAQFIHWLNQGYLINQVGITYDFHIDLQKLAPSLAQHLFFLPPEGYHFIGTHIVDNTKMIPDSCLPNAAYISQRGNLNITTATLGGVLYLNKKPYPIEAHQQIFPHQKIEEKVFLKDETKKFYHYQWIAQSEITAKVTYKEFPTEQINNWPQVPSGTYSVVQREPGDKEKIKHLACLDGSSGDEVNISNGRVFLIECAARKDEKAIENIVKDADGKLYIIKYRNLAQEEAKAREVETKLRALEHDMIPKLKDWDQINHQLRTDRSNEVERRLKEKLAAHYEHTRNCSGKVMGMPAQGWIACQRCNLAIHDYSVSRRIEKEVAEHYAYLEREWERLCNELAADAIKYESIAGKPHPRRDEFRKK